MARRGRDMILQHINRGNDHIDRYLLHMMQIDGIYAGAKITDAEGNFVPVEIPPIKAGDKYGKIREYLHQLVDIAEQLKEMTDDIKVY